MKIPHQVILETAARLAPEDKQGRRDIHSVPGHQRLAFAAVVAREVGAPAAEVRELLLSTWLGVVGAMEASAVDHRIRKGDYPPAEFGGTSTGGWMARLQTHNPASGATLADAAPATLENIEANGLLYGYKLGPAERDTRAWTVARLLQNKTELTVEAAAFHKAVVGAHRHFGKSGIQLDFSMSRGTGLISDAPDAKVDFVPGREAKLEESELTVKQLFETLYGNFTRVFTTAYLQRSLQREPNAGELAKEMRELFATSRVDPGVYLRQLARSSDDADQALHRALVDG